MSQASTWARQCGDSMASTEENQPFTQLSGRYLRQKNIDPLKSPLASHQRQIPSGLLFERWSMLPTTISLPFQQVGSIMHRPNVESASPRNPRYGSACTPLG